MRLREGTDAHERGRDIDVGLFGEALELGMSLTRNETASDVEDGLLGFGDETENLLQLLVAGLGAVGVFAVKGPYVEPTLAPRGRRNVGI